MGTLYLVSTPIGNIDDISIRAIKLLFTADIIACEDTRQTGQLLTILKERFSAWIKPNAEPAKLISYHDKNEENVVPELITYLQGNQSIVLVSDAGTPLISDPGYRLVTAAIKRNIQVTPIPGVSAILPALQLSGFPVHEWMFIGYLPEKQSHRLKKLKELENMKSYTIISYCAPHKLKQTLDDLLSVYGSTKQVAVIKELTKIHEAVIRGSVTEVLAQVNEVKGEIVLVF